MTGLWVADATLQYDLLVTLAQVIGLCVSDGALILWCACHSRSISWIMRCRWNSYILISVSHSLNCLNYVLQMELWYSCSLICLSLSLNWLDDVLQMEFCPLTCLWEERERERERFGHSTALGPYTNNSAPSDSRSSAGHGLLAQGLHSFSYALPTRWPTRWVDLFVTLAPQIILHVAIWALDLTFVCHSPSIDKCCKQSSQLQICLSLPLNWLDYMM